MSLGVLREFFFFLLFNILYILANDHNNDNSTSTSSNTNQNLCIKGNKDFWLIINIIWNQIFNFLLILCLLRSFDKDQKWHMYTEYTIFHTKLSHELRSITFDYYCYYYFFIVFVFWRFEAAIAFPTSWKSFYLNILSTSCAQ